LIPSKGIVKRIHFWQDVIKDALKQSSFSSNLLQTWQERIQDFKFGGAHLKKLHRAEGGTKIFGVFRVKNDFTPKNHIFSNCGGRRENFWGISCEKSRFYAKKSYFFQLRREARKFLGYFVWKITILRQKIIFFPILGGGACRVHHPCFTCAPALNTIITV
jgi:hypothetical protein